MKKLAAILMLFLVGDGFAALAQTPQATDMPGNIFTIKKTWIIGGEGNWNYLTFDPSALKLYIAHGSAVQVVDVNEGKLSGQVTGLREARQIVLDPESQFGYVSDGPANAVKVFDRESLEIVANIPTCRNPDSLVLDPSTGLLFAICSGSAPEGKIPRRNGQHNSNALANSTITVIDAQTRAALADLAITGKLGFAQGDGNGTIYVNVTDRSQIGYFNAQGLESSLRKLAGAPSSGGAKPEDSRLVVDWTDSMHDASIPPSPFHSFHLGSDCQSPTSLAVDSVNLRIFAACDNMKMQVLNATNGDVVATLPIGAGTDAIGYDPDRGLIYASNGGGVGSITIIRRNLTDSYAVVQELPTQARARTLAVNPVSGDVYLVTNITGFDLTHNGGIGGLKTATVSGSFQVLVVGH